MSSDQNLTQGTTPFSLLFLLHNPGAEEAVWTSPSLGTSPS